MASGLGISIAHDNHRCSNAFHLSRGYIVCGGGARVAHQQPLHIYRGQQGDFKPGAGVDRCRNIFVANQHIRSHGGKYQGHFKYCRRCCSLYQSAAGVRSLEPDRKIVE